MNVELANLSSPSRTLSIDQELADPDRFHAELIRIAVEEALAHQPTRRRSELARRDYRPEPVAAPVPTGQVVHAYAVSRDGQRRRGHLCPPSQPLRRGDGALRVCYVLDRELRGVRVQPPVVHAYSERGSAGHHPDHCRSRAMRNQSRQ